MADSHIASFGLLMLIGCKIVIMLAFVKRKGVMYGYLAVDDCFFAKVDIAMLIIV